MKTLKLQLIILLTFALSFAANQISDTVTLHAESAPLASVLAMLAEESGYNIVTGSSVNDKEKLTIHLTDVQIDQAINLVVRASGLSYEIVGNSILVANRSNIMEDVGVKPHVITLQYANPDEIVGLLSNVTSQITVEKSGNRLLIHASPKKIAEIEEIIKKIDVPALQIMLEAKLIEVSMSDQETMGLDWAKLAKLGYIVTEAGSPIEFVGGATSGSLIPGLSVSQDENGNVLELLAPEKPGLSDEMYFQRFSDGAIPFSNGAARQLTQFDVTLDFLLRNNKAEILANSQVVTLNGHEAEISMVDVVPYILSSGGVGGQVKVQREEVGIKLKIVPTVNSDGYITTSVTPEVSSIYDMIGPDRNIPHVKKRLSNTTIRVKDGETIIIAGLLSAGKRLDVSKFPLLWRLPYIGAKIFTHTSEVIVKTDLIVQITPRIIHDNYSGIDKNKNHQSAEDNLEN
tara:strand:- start:239 stop:1615 length:1377 start_codon:yes stop_codon:yes gene_type:complete